MKLRGPMRLFMNDEGYTSLAVMLAAALVVVLALSGAQVVWANSTGATAQHVADSAALAGENVVAKFVTIAKVMDAIILSLSLTCALLFIVTTVLSCIPYVQTFAQPVFNTAKQLLRTRNNLSESAASALNTLQSALPVLMQANASSVVSANNGSLRSAYKAIVVPSPLEGEPIASKAVDTDVDALEQANVEAQKHAKEAEEAAEKMQRNLEKAYRADCIDNPMCFYSRAQKLAGMEGAVNPHYATIDGWSFAVPLGRAQEYYRRRFLAEQQAPLKADPIEAARDMARREFFAIAIEYVSRGYASSSGDLSKNLNIPLLPRNSDDMRKEAIYTSVQFPVSMSGEMAVLHYSVQCPGYGAGSPAGLGSLAQQEGGHYKRCGVCDFSIITMGKAPSASTSINNGSEYYYRTIGEAAAAYKEAAETERENLKKARNQADTVKPLLEKLLKEITGTRITARPPGFNGCVAVVADAQTATSPIVLEPKAKVPPRIAISGAALADYPKEEGATVLTNALGGIAGKARGDSSSGGLGQPILSLWSKLLVGYGDGVEGIKKNLSSFLSSVPGFSGSTSRSWGSGFGDEILDLAGLAPSDISILRPVLVNSSRVFKQDPAFGARLSALQESYLSSPGENVGGAIDGVVSLVTSCAAQMETVGVEKLEGTFTLGTFSLFGVSSIPLNVRLPEAVIEEGKRLLARAKSDLVQVTQAALSGGTGGWRVWH